MNMTAWDEDRLVGCARLLTDGYFLTTITEILVLPDYRKKGIGRVEWYNKSAVLKRKEM
jgi:GNAT superfamily N-acetyltransferase